MGDLFRFSEREVRILDWDIETVAAGFADPEWVPQKITCVAWSWIGEDEVYSEVCGPEGLFGNPNKRAKMLKPLLSALDQADMWTGHNLIGFDIPVLVSECLRLGLSVPKATLVQDTMKIVHTKGFKRGQDNISQLLKAQNEKIPLSWQQWQDAYDEKGWFIIRNRCEKDVIQHKEMRQGMIELGWLKPPRKWSPK